MLTRNLQLEQTPDTAPAAYSSPEAERPTSSNAPPSEVISDFKDDPDVTAPIAPSPHIQQTELRSAETTISDEGLRQRKGIAPADTKPRVSEIATAAAVRPQGTEGVPIQIVAILCLVSFLLAYFFF